MYKRLWKLFPLVLFALTARTATAQLYWDVNGTTVYSGNAGGLWDGAFWSSDVNGLATPSGYVANSFVNFAAGTDGLGTYTVTLPGNQTVSGINFLSGHVTIAPETTSPIASVQILTLSGTAPTVNVQNMDSTISSRVTSSGLTKTGYGKLSLNFGAIASSGYFIFTGAPITVNSGTLELTGTGGSADQMTTNGSIVINNGGTFLWGGNANNISNSTRFTINVGGTMIAKISDNVGSIEGAGHLSLQGGTLNLSQGSANTTFSGLITGGGNIYASSGTGILTLANANTFTGAIGSVNTNTNTGGIRLAHNRAAQYATLTLNNFDTSKINVSFASDIGTFVTGGLTGISKLTLEDVSGAPIDLQVGNNDASTTYRGSLSGSGGLTKIGIGILTLTGEYLTVTNTTSNTVITTAGTSSHTYTGDTTILSGTHTNAGISGNNSSNNLSTLKLDFNAQSTSTTVSGNTYTMVGTAPTSNIISSASRLVLGGGRLWVAGNNAGTAVSQTFNNTLIKSGRNFVTVTQGSTPGNTVVNLGNITRENAATLEFFLPNGAISLSNGITTTTPNDASGILGAWAIVGSDWAIKNTAGNTLGNVVAAGSELYTAYTSGDIVSTGTTNLLINNTEATISTGAGVTDINTLMLRDAGSATPRLIDIGSGETLRFGANGGLWNQGSLANTLTIGSTVNVGSITAGGADNTDGELVINHSGSGDMTLRSSIRDNGTGVVTVIRTGNSPVILSGTNYHTGGTIFTQGRTRADSIGALSTGSVTVVAGGQLWVNASGVFNNDFYLAGTGYGEGTIPGAIRMRGGETLGTSAKTITLTGDTRLGAVNSSSPSTLAGKITGDYALDLAGGAGGTNIIVLSHTGNDFTGNLSINTNLNSTSAFNLSALVTVRLGASEVIPHGLGKGNVIISGGTGTVSTNSATLDLFGFNETINSLISYGNHANVFVTNSKASTTSTLTLGGNDNSTSTSTSATYNTFYGGTLQDGAGVLALTKIGKGTQTLSGTSTYSGATLIQEGTLQTGAANALSPNSDITISEGSSNILSLSNGLADYSQTIKSLSGGGVVILGTVAAADTAAAPGVRLTTGSTADTLYSGLIVGGGGLVKQGSGRFTLTGPNTYVGTTTVNAGNLQIGVAGVGQSGSGAVDITSSGTLSGTGTVRGATTVSGLLSPGDNGGASIGQLVFSDLTASSLTLSGGGSASAPRLLFTLNGATGNVSDLTGGITNPSLLDGTFGQHDALEVQGTLNLTSGSTIKIELADGYSPTLGDVFNLMDWGTISGTLNAGGFNAASVGGDLDLELSNDMLTNGWIWNTSQFLSSGIIYVAAVPEPSRVTFLLLALGLLIMRRRRN
ncbi:PEP-CTERM protein-sorting domain-containing protein [Prosthecobacter debontii]|uniref:PEP-CTERM protein-sorting domain-containing protein n=1 Tax=Prosthecobacter debontii TaxID=48467 RepID=A0A1T4YFG7_9BACT|nr:autotransporter-associated beta strand repeat-containing protein [Prosthecobacter debontii]SKB00514.1 PEP-CTERM protein-sorting domain-containing protein [Prosthecobacter debontii]